MKRLIVIGAMSFLFLAGCEKSVEPAVQGVPDQTDGRITVINDEAKLAGRVTIRDEDLTISSGLPKAAAPLAFSLKLNSEITPPTVGGQKLQATSVVLNANFAYVSYNVQGSSAIGAIDVVQVKGVKNAVIRASVQFADTDVNTVFFDNNMVYLAEASGNPAYDSPSFVEALVSNGGKLQLSGNAKRMLSSYAATSVVASNGKVYATTGNTGGLYVLTQNSTLDVESFTSLEDARWVDLDANYVVVAQGTPGRLSVFNRSTMALLNTYSVPGATIAESKSTVRIIGGKGLFAAGDAGVQLVNLATGSIVGSLPRVTVSGLDPSVTVTNAVDAAGAYVYISNGEAGIYVAQASQALENLSGNTTVTLTTLGKLQFTSLQSANHVAFDGKQIAVAAGLGGVKLVDMTE